MTFAVRFVFSLLFAFVSLLCLLVMLPCLFAQVMRPCFVCLTVSNVSVCCVVQLIARYGLNCPLSSCPVPLFFLLSPLFVACLLFVLLLSSHEKYRFPPFLPSSFALSFVLSLCFLPFHSIPLALPSLASVSTALLVSPFPLPVHPIAPLTVSISIYLIIYLFICYLYCSLDSM